MQHAPRAVDEGDKAFDAAAAGDVVFFAGALVDQPVTGQVHRLAIGPDREPRPIDWTFLVILVPSLLAMSTILLTNFFEFVEMF